MMLRQRFPMAILSSLKRSVWMICGYTLLTSCAATQNASPLPPGGGPAMMSSKAKVPSCSGVPFTEVFTGTTLNPCWTISSPNSDSSVGLNGKGSLLMKASPLNGGSDLCPCSNYSAPVILQPVSPTVDWTITTKLKVATTNDFEGAGILLAYQPGGFTSSSQQFERAIEVQYRASIGEQICSFGILSWAYCGSYAGKLVFFEIVKSGLTYSTYFSSNGKTWVPAASQSVSTAYTWVGLVSMRQPWDGNESAYTNAYFKYFKAKVKK